MSSTVGPNFGLFAKPNQHKKTEALKLGLEEVKNTLNKVDEIITAGDFTSEMHALSVDKIQNPLIKIAATMEKMFQNTNQTPSPNISQENSNRPSNK